MGMKTLADIQQTEESNSDGLLTDFVKSGESLVLKNAEILQGSKGEYTILDIEHNKKDLKVRSSSSPIIQNVKTMLENGLGKDSFTVTFEEKVAESSGRRYFTFV